MGFLGLFGNYDKPGPGVNKDEPPKAAPVRFFEILFRKFTKLVQLNLIFIIPTLVALALMFLLASEYRDRWVGNLCSTLAIGFALALYGRAYPSN